MNTHPRGRFTDRERDRPDGARPRDPELTLEPIDEFAQPELRDSVVIALDQRDEFPEEVVRRMCGEELDRLPATTPCFASPTNAP